VKLTTHGHVVGRSRMSGPLLPPICTHGADSAWVSRFVVFSTLCTVTFVCLGVNVILGKDYLEGFVLGGCRCREVLCRCRIYFVLLRYKFCNVGTTDVSCEFATVRTVSSKKRMEE
jgi:hypothetical protein